MEERIIKEINALLTQLFSKMHEAGYEWDAEKKELKKIEYETEIPFGAKDSELQEVTYFIPKGFHAEIDDDKVVIKKGEKPAEWSEKDNKIIEEIINDIECATAINYHAPKEGYEFRKNWLKSLKNRVQPDTVSWSEENKEILDEIIDFFENGTVKLQHDLSLYASWLKSLRPQNTWKPSDEQMEQLGWIAKQNKDNMIGKELMSLYQDLKNLREE